MEPKDLTDEIALNKVERKSESVKSISIVIPAYNEENRIGKTIYDLLSVLDNQDQLIVVFDGTDQTPEVVKSFGSNVELLTSDRRLGKGGAILTGFQQCRNEVIGFIDADNSVPVHDVIRLARDVNESKPCVIASRWVKSSSIVKNEPFFNIFASRIFHYLVYLVLGIKVKDTQCGAKFFKKDLIKVILPKVTIKSRMIDVTLLYHVKLLGKEITEVGVKWEHDEDTKLPILKAIPFMFATVIGLKLRHHKMLKSKAHILGKFLDSFQHN